jgi:hypothetical protein
MRKLTFLHLLRIYLYVQFPQHKIFKIWAVCGASYLLIKPVLITKNDVQTALIFYTGRSVQICCRLWLYLVTIKLLVKKIMTFFIILLNCCFPFSLTYFSIVSMFLVNTLIKYTSHIAHLSVLNLELCLEIPLDKF